MGDSGSLVLVNGTPYTWQLTYSHSYQLTQWTFPRTVAPFTSAAITVQRSNNVLRDSTQDGGEATYALLNTPKNPPPTFQVQARADSPGFRLQVQLASIAAQNNPTGSTVSVGWVVNGQSNFVFAGTQSSNSMSGFVCNNPPTAWMAASLPLLGSRLLKQICMPGTHDAGTLHMCWPNYLTSCAFCRDV